MGRKAYFDELERASARPDARQMCEQLDAYAAYYANGMGAWPEPWASAFDEIISCNQDDPEKALAYVVLGASRSEDASFLAGLGCGPLEDILHDPSDQLLQRIVDEARKSERFCWLLSCPYKIAVAARAWDAIETFRITGPHEEPAAYKLPRRR